MVLDRAFSSYSPYMYSLETREYKVNKMWLLLEKKMLGDIMIYLAQETMPIGGLQSFMQVAHSVYNRTSIWK